MEGVLFVTWRKDVKITSENALVSTSKLVGQYPFEICLSFLLLVVVSYVAVHKRLLIIFWDISETHFNPFPNHETLDKLNQTVHPFNVAVVFVFVWY